MDPMMEKIYEERRKQFEIIYEETFGEKVDWDKAKEEATEQVFVLNIYGIKSNWM